MGFRTLLFLLSRTQIDGAFLGGNMKSVNQHVRLFFTISILFTATLSSFNLFGAVNPADEILHKARLQLDAQSDQAHVALKITEPNGDVKSREMTLQILRTKEGFKSMVRM